METSRTFGGEKGGFLTGHEEERCGGEGEKMVTKGRGEEGKKGRGTGWGIAKRDRRSMSQTGGETITHFWASNGS